MTPEILPLYPDYPQVIPAGKEERLIEERGCVDNVHYPTLTVFRPFRDFNTGCAAVICPGGGYSVLATDHEGTQTARWLSSIGVTAFVLKYRLPPQYCHPVPLQDAQRALRIVRSSAAQWKIHPERIGIMGFSAGGHLAATLATHFDAGHPAAVDPVEQSSCRPDFAVLGYPVICFAAEYCHSRSRANLLGNDASKEMQVQLSSERHVNAHTPPTFLFHSQNDKGVDPRNSIDYFLACKQHNVPAELHLFSTGGHGYGMGKRGTTESQWPALCERWLEQLGMFKREG